MDRTLDIFRNDAFSQATLRTRRVNMPFVPGALGAMNLFTPVPIDTTKVYIYVENNQLRLIPATLRGGPDIQAQRDTGEFFAVETLRLSKMDQVNASELLGITDPNTPFDTRLVSAVNLTNRRMAKLRQEMEATKELHRLGALQGKLVDADGTTLLFDFFEAFGLSQPAPVEIDFAGLGEDDLALEFQDNFFVPMARSIQTRNGGMAMGMGLRIGALVSDGFWRKMLTHPALRELWKAQQQGQTIAMAANPLATPPLWTSITYAGVTWIHYMGAISGPLQIPTDQAILFPMGVPDIFEVYFAPGETLGTVGQLGEPDYMIVRPDVRADPEFVQFIHRSYPLYACTYPQILRRAVVGG